ncbi:unnamed protein product [Soboliphyme baturini]|uniref:Fibronectin type-III domain-containing protein n=1 Tax=Soboliphyme baturini TaxID=241478 RepID=A0A183IXU4_9BILA|nr:unnamed protein product [Soboliphyme baturini]
MIQSSPFDVTIEWIPGFDGGHEQFFLVRFWRNSLSELWETLNVSSTTTRYVASHMQPNVAFTFEITPRNKLGAGGTRSVTGRTMDDDHIGTALPTDSSGFTYFPDVDAPIGPIPERPENFRLHFSAGNVVFMWDPPKDLGIPVFYYRLEFRENVRNKTIVAKHDSEMPRFSVFKDRIRSTQLGVNSSYFRHGVPYDFHVRSRSVAAFSNPSNTARLVIPDKMFDVALLAGIFGGLLFLLLFLVIGVTCVKIARFRSRRRSRSNNKDMHWVNSVDCGQNHHQVISSNGSQSKRPNPDESWGFGEIKQSCKIHTVNAEPRNLLISNRLSDSTVLENAGSTFETEPLNNSVKWFGICGLFHICLLLLLHLHMFTQCIVIELISSDYAMLPISQESQVNSSHVDNSEAKLIRSDPQGSAAYLNSTISYRQNRRPYSVDDRTYGCCYHDSATVNQWTD